MSRGVGLFLDTTGEVAEGTEGGLESGGWGWEEGEGVEGV